MSHAESGSGTQPPPASITQIVHAEVGYAYAVIGADLHVWPGPNRGPVFVLAEYRPAAAPDLARPLEQPSRLLNAQSRVVAFTGRESELDELSRWRDARGSRLSVRWLHGPGGAGKTRLAEEFADGCVAAGWKAVTAVHVSGSVQPSPGSQDLRTDTAAGLLLVVDYADRWPLSHLAWLMSNALLHRDVPTRVLLLARSAYLWPAIEAAFADLAADSADQVLAPLPGQGEPAARQRMFTAARDAFAARYELADPSRIAPPRELAGSEFGLTLTVHMAALVAVDAVARGDTAATSPAALSVYLLNREQQYWRRLYETRVEGGEFDTAPSVMGRLVFTAALTGATGHGDGVRLLRALDLPGHPDRLLSDHGVCYPAAQPGAVLEPLYPDRLAEDFLALTLPGHSVTGYASGTWAVGDVARLVLGESDVAGEGDGNGPVPHLGRAMTFLAAAAAPGRWPHVAGHLAELLRADPTLAASAGGGALAALAELDDLDPDVLAAIDAHLPERPQADLDLGIAAITERLTGHRLGSTTDPVTRARLLTTLARRCANAGLHQQAADAAGQAIALLHTLAEADPEAVDPDLAAALYQHCRALAGLGRRTESLAAIEQAAAIHRRLAAIDPAYLPQLAASLYLLGRELSDPGQMPQAVAVAQESVAAYRTLIRDDPQAVLPDFATALNSLAVRLLQAGRHAESLPPMREATAIRRRLAEADPAGYLPDLATALNNLGSALPRLDRREEALAVTEEAVAIRRRLAETNPHAYLPVLALSLMNLGLRFAELGRDDRVVAPLREAVAAYRELAQTNPGAHREYLAQSLFNLAGSLRDAQRTEAVLLFEEAVAICRSLAAERPASYLPLLAKILNNLSVALSAAGRNKQALACIEEAVEIRMDLWLEKTNSYEILPELVSALENLEITLKNLRRHKQALEPAEQATAFRRLLATRSTDAIAAARTAVDTARELAEADPEEYLPDLAGALAYLAALLIEHGQLQQSLAPSREAADLYRRLAEADPALYLRRLAGALQSRVNALSGLQRLAEAPTWELVAALRRLAEADPAQYRPALARALYNLSITGALAGEIDAAAGTLGEAIELYTPLARQSPGEYKAELRAARSLAARLSIVPAATAKARTRMRKHGLRPTWADRLGLTSGPVLAIAAILTLILTAIAAVVLFALGLVLNPPFLLARAAWRRARAPRRR